MTPEWRKRLEEIASGEYGAMAMLHKDDALDALAEIDVLRKHNQDLQRSYDEACSDAAAYESEAVRLRAENDRLTAEVARWRHLYESQHMPKHDGFKPTEAP